MATCSPSQRARGSSHAAGQGSTAETTRQLGGTSFERSWLARSKAMACEPRSSRYRGSAANDPRSAARAVRTWRGYFVTHRTHADPQAVGRGSIEPTNSVTARRGVVSKVVVSAADNRGVQITLVSVPLSCGQRPTECSAESFGLGVVVSWHRALARPLPPSAKARPHGHSDPTRRHRLQNAMISVVNIVRHTLVSVRGASTHGVGVGVGRSDLAWLLRGTMRTRRLSRLRSGPDCTTPRQFSETGIDAS